MTAQILLGLTLALGQVGPNGPPGSSFPVIDNPFASPGIVNRGQVAQPEQKTSVMPELLNAPQQPVQPEQKPEQKPDDSKAPAEKKPDDSKIPEGYKAAPPTILPPSIWQNDSTFLGRFLKGYYDAFYKKEEDSTPAERRAQPEPWSSPPFPGHEYQGYPLMGVPRDETVYPLMQAINGIPYGIGDAIKDSHIKVYGWATASGNFSTSSQTNSPTSYWIVPNSFQLDQLVLRFEREADTVQTDHWDWGFRSTFMYGEDYRYTTAGGWMSDQLLKNNRLYGLDPIEQYFDVYVPRVLGDVDMVVRVGRWVACPDIETQLAPDNYMGSHSLLFTYDSYTQTGIMTSFRLNDQNMVQCAIQAGTDMAPWYQGATPTAFFAWRWVSKDNNDAFYTCVNNLNDAIFRKTTIDGQPAGHDNFNYVVSTWEHRFNEDVHTKTEGYFMWQRDAYTGGTVSIGNPQSFGGGGGIGTFIPGYSLDYGVLNYTMFKLSKMDYLTIRNEVWNDPQGERTGFQTLYSSHSIGWSHNFSSVLQFRPEIGYYHSYNEAAFDFGTKHGMLMGGFDVTIRF